jgi:hypothetical protein
LSALKKKLKDPTIPRLTWQIASHPTEAENCNSGYSSDSSATFCSAFETVSGMRCHADIQISGQHRISNDHREVQATEGVSSHMGTDTHEINNNHMIFNITKNNNNSLVNVDDEEGFFSNSPVFHDMNEDLSHLINSLLSNDSIDNTFLTTVDTENGGDNPGNTNSEAVVASNLTADYAKLLCGVQANLKDTHSDSTATEVDSWALSADMFANSSSVTEPKDCNSKNSLITNEQNGVKDKSVQPQIDDEVMEIGKALSRTLKIVSTDSTSGSSPDTVMPQTILSASTNSGKDKNKLENTHKKAGSFKFQDPTSGHRKRSNGNQNSKELRSKSRFQRKEADSDSSTEKLQNGHRKKTANLRKSDSKANSPRNRNHRFRKQTGNARVNQVMGVFIRLRNVNIVG